MTSRDRALSVRVWALDQSEELGNGGMTRIELSMRPTSLEEMESLVVMATNSKRSSACHSAATEHHPGLCSVASQPTPLVHGCIRTGSPETSNENKVSFS